MQDATRLYFPLVQLAGAPDEWKPVTVPSPTLEAAKAACDDYRRKEGLEPFWQPKHLAVRYGYEGPIIAQRYLVTGGADAGFWSPWTGEHRSRF